MDSTQEDALPEGWTAQKSRNTGEIYYINKDLGKAQWHKPKFPNKLVDDDGDEVECSHILIKHSKSCSPKSWREDVITRTREDAYAKLNEFRRIMRKKEAPFQFFAKVFSDCPSAKHCGALGRIKKGETVKPFEDVLFSLQVCQISEPFDTESGVHIIWRTG